MPSPHYYARYGTAKPAIRILHTLLLTIVCFKQFPPILISRHHLQRSSLNDEEAGSMIMIAVDLMALLDLAVEHVLFDVFPSLSKRYSSWGLRL